MHRHSRDVNWILIFLKKNSGDKLTGAATKSRTRDLLITNQLLYLLSYSGTHKTLCPPSSQTSYSQTSFISNFLLLKQGRKRILEKMPGNVQWLPQGVSAKLSAFCHTTFPLLPSIPPFPHFPPIPSISPISPISLHFPLFPRSQSAGRRLTSPALKGITPSSVSSSRSPVSAMPRSMPSITVSPLSTRTG